MIQPCALPEATELAELLTRYDIEGLLLAHDTLASHDIAVVSPTLSEVGERILPEEPPRMPVITPSHTPMHSTPAHVPSSFNEEHIKIIKIEKTHEPLVRICHYSLILVLCIQFTNYFCRKLGSYSAE